MADIKDCIGKTVQISNNSITIKGDDGKTCGVVRNIASVKNMQPNKQVDYFHLFKRIGVWGDIDISRCIVKDGVLYIFRSMKSKLFHEKYGFFSNDEKKKAEKEENTFNRIKEAGIEIIECIVL